MKRLTVLFVAIMAVASIVHAGMSRGEARLKLWKANNAQPNATATIDGNTVVTINGSTTLAADAMAIDDVDVDAEMAAYQAEQDAIAAAPAVEAAAMQAAIDELGLTTNQIANIQAYFDADVDTLFSGMTANQRAFLKMQRALVKALAKREVKEVR